MRKFCVLLLMLAALPLMAQDNIVDRLEESVPGQGVITIHQDERLDALLGRVLDSCEGVKSHTVGYRIQVYAGSNTSKARSEAYGAGARVKAKCPGVPVYTQFNSPRWVCRVGDFRTIEEADHVLRRLKEVGGFREVILLPNQRINITL
jgi:hypothetical protein